MAACGFKLQRANVHGRGCATWIAGYGNALTNALYLFDFVDAAELIECVHCIVRYYANPDKTILYKLNRILNDQAIASVYNENGYLYALFCQALRSAIISF
jgi:hypothetical protein